MNVKTRFVTALCIVVLAGASTPLVAQQYSSYIGDPWDWYARTLSLHQDIERPYLSIRSLSTNTWDIPEETVHPWDDHLKDTEPVASIGPTSLEILPLSTSAGYNSTYPHGGNDEAAWQGKGFNSFGTGGVRFNAPYVSVTLAPQVWFAQNQDFKVVTPTSEADDDYGSFTPGLDDYQRPGGSSAGDVTWGQSEVRAEWRNLTAGFGTQNLWIGPTQHNPILLSNNAPGFPKLDIGLRKTETRIGDFEALVFFGRLEESDYFDDDDSNDYRFVGASSVSYAPSFIPGFTVGLHRFVLSDWDSNITDDALELARFGMDRGLGDDERDQRLSFTLDWRFPQVGFNVYGEWAKNDFSDRWRYIVRAPEHSQAFTIGGRQTIDGPGRGLFVVTGEISQLIRSRDYYIDLGVGRSGFYSHGKLPQGHTNLGQILGAPIGSGAAGQRLDVDYIGTLGSVGLFVQRTARNQDYLYADGDLGDIERANVEMRYGSRGVFLHEERLTLSGEFSIARNINRNYVEGNDEVNLYGLVEFLVRL